jgi:2-succinyl-5-enolpyruvyl-6-hydroxy-3-cyclohexene-1-carboxylate synthase
MIYPKIPLAQSVIEICKAKGIQHIVISPGSRNAPLTIGFTNNPYFTCYSIADERCAAFFAMGIAQQIQKPVAVVCTSGSAVLNYYPAVAEAFYSQIPLVILSADRPQNKIDIGDGQTIRQENVFANHILFSANLTELASKENDSLINQAINSAVENRGPVHINIPFEEPLYDTVETLEVTSEIIPMSQPLNDFELEKTFISQWNQAKKKLILVGELFPNTLEKEIIQKLGEDESIVVVTEATSNLHHPNFITNIDSLITPFSTEDFEAFQPEILVTFGGMVVSKRIKAFLRKFQPKNHWHVDKLRAYDTFGCLSQHFKTNPNLFFNQILTESTTSDYQKHFLTIHNFRKQKREIYTHEIPFSDFKVFDFLSKRLPEVCQLQISNSSAIRYMQLFDLNPNTTVFCNRGTSGIDGSSSTAIGAALVSPKPTILITGDISFFYDSNALWNNYIPKNFKIILVNNNGGGIFRILPGHQETPTFNTFFETSHHLNASHLAKMFDFQYFNANSSEDLERNWEAFITNENQPSILEIFTPEKENNKILLEFFKKIT